MKYLRVASDLHCEQYSGQTTEFLCDAFLPPDPRDKESILVLAGDISSKPAQLHSFLEECLKRFLKVIFVSGNHEYYGHAMDTWETGFREWADTTKILAGTSEIKCVEIDKVRFIFGTYWADGGATPQESALVEAFLRDFYVVRATEQIRWTVPRMAEAHRTQKKQLETFLEQPFEGKTVVISHHLPSYRLCHPRFGNDANGGFASNSDLILATEKVDCWIFGHTHDTIDHMMWKTRMVCNPAGYHREKDERYHKFAPKFINVSDIALPNHA